MRCNLKCVQGVRGVLCISSILSTLRNSKLFLDIETHHDRVDTPDRVNGKSSKQGFIEASSERLMVVIVRLNPPSFGCCSLCHRWATLPFCLEYFNRGDMVLWGEICEICAAETREDKRK